MGKNTRYESHFDALQDARIDGSARCVTLPQQAYGPNPIEWYGASSRPAVWAWVQWCGAPAERIPGVALGANDRVVVFGWYSDGGFRDTVVWRNAVSVRGL